MAGQILSVRDLRVYSEAFELQQIIFQLSRKWPSEERYALTDQVRRSSRSVGANIAEAWAKRKYPLSFVSKLVDSDGELHETAHWISSALACGYINGEQHADYQARINTIGKMLGKMISMPENFSPRSK